MQSILLVREDEVEDGGVVGDVRRIRALPATPAEHPVTHTQLGRAANQAVSDDAGGNRFDWYSISPERTPA